MNAQKETEERQRDLPCVWMIAGVLTHKLCDRQYDCEHCDLDHVLRNMPHEEAGEALEQSGISIETRDSCLSEDTLETQVNEYLSHIVAGSKLYLDRRYSRTYFWVYPENKDTAVVGLDSNILKLLYPITKVISPEKFAYLRKNQMCGLLVRDDMTIPLHTPISGEVIEVNPDFDDQLSSGILEEDTWLMKIMPDKPMKTVDELCQGEQMLKGYVRKIHLIKHYLREALSQTAFTEIGPTMADGGEVQLDLESVLGTELYTELIEEIFQIS